MGANISLDSKTKDRILNLALLSALALLVASFTHNTISNNGQTGDTNYPDNTAHPLSVRSLRFYEPLQILNDDGTVNSTASELAEYLPTKTQSNNSKSHGLPSLQADSVIPNLLHDTTDGLLPSAINKPVNTTIDKVIQPVDKLIETVLPPLDVIF